MITVTCIYLISNALLCTAPVPPCGLDGLMGWRSIAPDGTVTTYLKEVKETQNCRDRGYAK